MWLRSFVIVEEAIGTKVDIEWNARIGRELRRMLDDWSVSRDGVGEPGHQHRGEDGALHPLVVEGVDADQLLLGVERIFAQI